MEEVQDNWCRKRLTRRATDHDEWRHAVATGDAAALSALIFSAADSKLDVALIVLRDCLALLEKKLVEGASPRRAASSGAFRGPKSGAAEKGCLDALTVALSQSCGGEPWYTSTKELQLASRPFCAACRSAPTLRLVVRRDTPYRLFGAGNGSSEPTSVPKVRFVGVAWNSTPILATFVLLHTLVDAKCVKFGDRFDEEGLQSMSWPLGLRKLRYGSSFNQPLEGTRWPASLQQLTFGSGFNQQVEALTWPRSLKQITFGNSFDQPIQRVSWPAPLELLSLGSAFNQEIEQVAWPSSLRRLSLGDRFNQPIEATVWPRSLQQLLFGERFNQPIEHVVWPAALQRLSFLGRFNQPIELATWPSSLRELSLGGFFNKPVRGVSWPTSLEDLTFGHCTNDEPSARGGFAIMASFNHPIDEVVWPASLRRLTLGDQFRQSLQGLGSWMPRLEELRLFCHGHADYSDLLSEVEWPAALRQLTVFLDAVVEDLEIPQTVTIAYRGCWP